MTMNHGSGSAKIYTFPTGGRAGVRGRQPEDKLMAEMAALGLTKSVLGSSWYHEAAIKEDQPHKQ